MSPSQNKKYAVGDRLKFKSWTGLKTKALNLSAQGYGVAVIGFGDMSENILTITALPEEDTGKEG